MSRRHSFSLGVEALEGKLLLASSTRVHPSTIKAPVIKAPAPLILDGTFKGSILSATSTQGEQSTMSMPFSGRTKSLGQVKVVLDEVLSADGQRLIKGEITLRNKRGTILLTFGESDLVSMNQSASNASITARYQVGGGTGAYAGVSGQGTFTLGGVLSDVTNIRLSLKTLKS